MIKKIYVTFLALLIATSNCYATTEFVSTFNKTGQCYSSIQTWEDAMDNAGDLTDATVFTGDWDNQVNSDIADGTAVTWDSGSSGGTLVHMTATQYLIDVTSGSLADNDTITDGTNTFDIDGTPDDVILVLEIYSDSGKVSGGYLLDANGNTCDTTNYLWVRGAEEDRHDGTAGSGVWIETTTAQYMFVVRTGGTFKVSWLEFTDTNGAASDSPLLPVNGTTFISEYIIAHSIRPWWATHIAGIYYNFGAHAWGGTFYNCSIYADGDDCGWSNEICCHTCTAYNTVLFNENANSIYGNFYNGSGDYNMSNDTSSPGANSIDSQALTDIDWVSVESGTEDLHIETTSTAKDAGDDQSGVLTKDIDQETFGDDDTWDIGADEYVSATPATPSLTKIILISKLWLEALKAGI